jgi:hypothetical protein
MVSCLMRQARYRANGILLCGPPMMLQHQQQYNPSVTPCLLSTTTSSYDSFRNYACTNHSLQLVMTCLCCTGNTRTNCMDNMGCHIPTMSTLADLILTLRAAPALVAHAAWHMLQVFVVATQPVPTQCTNFSQLQDPGMQLAHTSRGQRPLTCTAGPSQCLLHSGAILVKHRPLPTTPCGWRWDDGAFRAAPRWCWWRWEQQLQAL